MHPSQCKPARLAKLSRKLVGNNNHRKLSTRGAPTWGVLLFRVDKLQVVPGVFKQLLFLLPVLCLLRALAVPIRKSQWVVISAFQQVR